MFKMHWLLPILHIITYYDRELQYLVGIGGQSAVCFFVGPKMGSIRVKKGPKVLGHFHDQNALVFCKFCIL